MVAAGTNRTRDRTFLYLRIAVTIVAWVIAITYLHRLFHAFEADILRILDSQTLRLALASTLLTVLVYFVILSLPAVPNPGLRGVGLVFIWALLLVVGHSLSHLGFHAVQAAITSMRDSWGIPALVILGFGYAVTLAVPFVPGVELGLLIMAVFGATGVLIAYAATIAGLSLGFVAGRCLPEQVTRILSTRLDRAGSTQDLESTMRDTVTQSRLVRRMPKKALHWLLKHCYLTLALCLNLPANSVLGGGGGLALLCGGSGQFHWRPFVLTVAVATAPIPVLVLLGQFDPASLLQHHGIVHNLFAEFEALLVHD